VPHALPTIAHVLTSFHVGGAERVALLLATSQKQRGYPIVVISLEEPPKGSLTSEFQAAGVMVRQVAKRPTGFDPSLFPRLLACFREARVDVVHTHNQLPLIYAALPGRLSGARVVHTSHGPHPDRPHRLWLRRAAAMSVQTFVAVSEATAAFAREISEVSPQKLRVILNATDLGKVARHAEARARVRGEWGIDVDGCVIGTVGRMAPEKNHALLLEAVRPILGDHALLVIAGDGSERAATEALAKKLGIANRVRFLGEVREVPAVLSGFDVFALSSHFEGLPMVLAEAMGASLPVVTTAVGGIPSVVSDGETGYLVPAGDVETLRERIRQLCNDRALARRMGERGLLVARQRYSLERMVDEYLGAYRVGSPSAM
jgi:glycosyltransferase involved in cell wall biosynthesis